MLVSQIKLKQFDQACTFLNGTPQDIRQLFIFEHAYILHRQGNNKNALTKLKELSKDAEAVSSYRYKHLLSQILYKLQEYEKSQKNYESILEANKEGALESEAPLDSDEIMDIITNYLACQSCAPENSEGAVKKTL